MTSKVKVAAVQAEPVWNDLQGGVSKVISLIKDAAKNGAKVVGFPEVFIPGYPWSIWTNSAIENVSFMNEYFENSMERESEEMERIKIAVREAGVFIVLGYSERYRGSLYIAQSFIDPTGTIVHHRRKIKPTHVERSYWGDGQADSLKTVAPSAFGNIGGLNCWEHTQPLLRYYEYAQNVDIHVASWPCLWNVPSWTYHASDEASSRFSQVMAMEGACFVLLPGGGFTVIFGPDGAPLTEPLDPGEEAIVYADIDLKDRIKAKQNLDIVGHYSRPDLLSLRVTTEAAATIHFNNT
ncbi:Nitrilase/cyanide hydratase and apolipoprotein N-acyltransferase [Aspergillus oryzae]|uniref:nitrilase n=1 Tax=Aspergillus oryzae TaxID=5062 RepID=A0A1S9DH55_ASPOZ|nr:Nitrilase/cyanide hydratase and apolipoprotein N-acyltransferase [Aspergillus oryzae]